MQLLPLTLAAVEEHDLALDESTPVDSVGDQPVRFFDVPSRLHSPSAKFVQLMFEQVHLEISNTALVRRPLGGTLALGEDALHRVAKVLHLGENLLKRALDADTIAPAAFGLGLGLWLGHSVRLSFLRKIRHIGNLAQH